MHSLSATAEPCILIESSSSCDRVPPSIPVKRVSAGDMLQGVTQEAESSVIQWSLYQPCSRKGPAGLPRFMAVRGCEALPSLYGRALDPSLICCGTPRSRLPSLRPLSFVCLSIVHTQRPAARSLVLAETLRKIRRDFTRSFEP
nr:hypothetical protein CFP56_22024 [Quercus suber]